MLTNNQQLLLFPAERLKLPSKRESSSTFVGNMTLPVHRWIRYSAGFSADWVESVIEDHRRHQDVRLFDPFAGSGTSLIAAENMEVTSHGIDSHPFVSRIAAAKLGWRSNPEAYRKKILCIRKRANRMKPDISVYPELIRKCYDDRRLAELDSLRQAYLREADETPASELSWLTLIAILRKVSTAGTAQWQYVLPKKQKRAPSDPLCAFDDAARMIEEDMRTGQNRSGPNALFHRADARDCAGVPDCSANLVVTSPPYPNNYDYADATRLEMSFMGEITGWGCLQQSVRRHLLCSCSQHVPEKTVDFEEVLGAPELVPIRNEIKNVCTELDRIRQNRGGRKTYHLMVACYFRDLARVWHALRRVCCSPSRVCFVIGDSAPYGVYVPVVPWLVALAEQAGFRDPQFEKTRDRNVKWKNRKHRVPLLEGRLWLRG